MYGVIMQMNANVFGAMMCEWWGDNISEYISITFVHNVLIYRSVWKEGHRICNRLGCEIILQVMSSVSEYIIITCRKIFLILCSQKCCTVLAFGFASGKKNFSYNLETCKNTLCKFFWNYSSLLHESNLFFTQRLMSEIFKRICFVFLLFFFFRLIFFSTVVQSTLQNSFEFNGFWICYRNWPSRVVLVF